MMLGEALSNPTVQIPSWDPYEEQTTQILSPFSINAASSPLLDSLTALHRYLPSNEPDLPIDAFSCDHFRMYEFKVRRCARGRSHDWTECPYAHPGEKARRRDPRKFHYSGTACPDFRKGGCKKGEFCEFAHGVFECWLHPARYRTQPCKDGPACSRRVCFFAHTPEQFRGVLPQSPRETGSGSVDFDSPMKQHLDSIFGKAGQFVSSPTSILMSPPVSPPSDSPPMSPVSPKVAFDSSELMASMRGMNVSSQKMGASCWVVQTVSRFGSPRGSVLGPGFSSLPTTPNRAVTRSGIWDLEEEPPMERVESGRKLRAKMYAKLSKENCLERTETGGSVPEVGWVSELVK